MPRTKATHGATGTSRGVRCALLGASLCSGLLAAASFAPAAADASPSPITLYSGQHVQTTQALINAFEKKTGIHVNARFDDEDLLADQLVTEGTHSPADVFFTENSPPLQFLASKRLLDPVDPSTLALTPSKYNSPNGKWAGISARVSVMIYNTSLLRRSQLPTSAMQLAQPKWNGKIGSRAARPTSSQSSPRLPRTHGGAAALRWLESLKANAGGHQYPDNETVVDKVNRGQVALAVINQYYWYRMQTEVGSKNVHSAIAYFAPRDVGYVIDVSGAGVLRSSRHEAEAQRFVAFLDSVQGQKIIAHSDSFEYPIASGVTTAQPQTPFDQLQPNPITIRQLGTGAVAIKLLQEAQLL